MSIEIIISFTLAIVAIISLLITIIINYIKNNLALSSQHFDFINRIDTELTTEQRIIQKSIVSEEFVTSLNHVFGICEKMCYLYYQNIINKKIIFFFQAIFEIVLCLYPETYGKTEKLDKAKREIFAKNFFKFCNEFDIKPRDKKWFEGYIICYDSCIEKFFTFKR